MLGTDPERIPSGSLTALTVKSEARPCAFKSLDQENVYMSIRAKPPSSATSIAPVTEPSSHHRAQLEAERRYRRALEEQGSRVLHRVVDREGNIVLMIEAP